MERPSVTGKISLV